MTKDKTYREDLDELIKIIPVWFNIGMSKAMQDGDPKHNKEYQKKAKQAIQEHIEGKVLEELEWAEKLSHDGQLTLDKLQDRIKQLKDKGKS